MGQAAGTPSAPGRADLTNGFEGALWNEVSGRSSEALNFYEQLLSDQYVSIASPLAPQISELAQLRIVADAFIIHGELEFADLCCVRLVNKAQFPEDLYAESLLYRIRREARSET